MMFVDTDKAAARPARPMRTTDRAAITTGSAFLLCLIMALTGTAGPLQAAEASAAQAPAGQAAASVVDSVPPLVGAVTTLPAAVPPGSDGPAAVLKTAAQSEPGRVAADVSVKRKAGAGRTGFVLGLSWLPAFCETRPGRTECKGQTGDRADAKQLTLAGLWPVRNTFCKVSETLQAQDRKRDWRALPPVPLTEAVAVRLADAMPGTASGFDRHTWLRSGSCQVLSADAYFSLQIRLLEAVNGSAVGSLFRSRVGGDVTEADVRGAFDQGFGPGAGDRIRIQCRQVGDRKLVTGLTIGLSPGLEETSDLATLIHAAAPVRSRCDGGVVDAAGRVPEQRQAAVRPAASGTGGAADTADVR